jgi:hypothetical protein
MKQNLGILGSAIDPTVLSKTVSGLIIACSSIIIFLLSQIGIVVGTEQISELATQVGLALGAITTIYGLIQKILVKTI